MSIEYGARSKLRISVIDLYRRPDGARSFRAALSTAGAGDLAERCRVVTPKAGRDLSETPDLFRLFGGYDAAVRNGAAGRALGHLSIWRSLAATGDEQLELVFEDHARPRDDLDRRLALALGEPSRRDREFDFALLGYSSAETEPEADSAGETRLRSMRWERYLGGSFAYLISGRGARKLVDLAERGGIQRGIDTFLTAHGPRLSVLEGVPPLAEAGARSGIGPRSVARSTRRRSRRAGIAIYAGPGYGRWDPTDIVTRGLGGSETACCRLAESLSELGYIVTLYGDCDRGMIRDVLIRDWRTFAPSEPRLAVISCRRPELFDHELAAERRFLWFQDVDSGDRLTPERAAQIDSLLCVSDWHRRHLAHRYPFAEHQLVAIRNGIVPSYFSREPGPTRERRVLFTSSPERGLDLLLELWPEIYDQLPDATLAFSNAPVYDQIADQKPDAGGHRNRIRALAEQPGVRRLPSLGQPQLAALMRASLVWAHPSRLPNGVRFDETSCIGAMEAQAAGCCVVAADWGALPETVRVGTLVGGDPGLEPFREQFAEAIVAGLTDERVQAHAQAEGPRLAPQWSWDGVAETVAGLIESDRAGGPHGHAER